MQKAPAITGGRMARMLDGFVGLFSPSAGVSRAKSRARLAYSAAKNGRERPAPDRLRGPNHPSAQAEGITLMRRSRELVENSGFFRNIKAKILDYSVGWVRYSPQTGDPMLDGAVKDWLDHWFLTCDATSRFDFCLQMRLLMGGVIDDGDQGILHIVEPDGSYRIQNIEGDRIGNPYHIASTPNKIRGVNLEGATPVSYDIYSRSISDSYTYEATIPKDQFTLFYRPERYDAYRGVPAFAAVTHLYSDVQAVRSYEMLSMKWASAKGGFVKSAGASIPEDDFPSDAEVSGGLRIAEIRPGEILYGEPGDEIDFLSNDRPSPNVMAFIESFLREGAQGVSLPVEWVHNAAGLQGTATRLVSRQAQRVFEGWQREINDRVMIPIKNRAIMSGIYQGYVPYDDKIFGGRFIFPPHPTVDAGRDTKSALDEYRAGLSSARDYCAEDGKHWEDVINQKALEAQKIIRKAREIAESEGVPVDVALNLLSLSTPNGIQPIQKQEGGVMSHE